MSATSFAHLPHAHPGDAAAYRREFNHLAPPKPRGSTLWDRLLDWARD